MLIKPFSTKVKVVPKILPFCKLSNFNRRNVTNYQIVRPGNVSPIRTVPKHISLPRYHVSPRNSIDLKIGNSLEKMQKSCKLARKILDLIGQQIKV